MTKAAFYLFLLALTLSSSVGCGGASPTVPGAGEAGNGALQDTGAKGKSGKARIPPPTK